MKVVPQASNCREIEVGGRIYRRDRNGLFNMPEAAARYTIKNEGGQEAALSGTTRRAIGFICRPCNFGTFFRTCSKCGRECERDNG